MSINFNKKPFDCHVKDAACTSLKKMFCVHVKNDFFVYSLNNLESFPEKSF